MTAPELKPCPFCGSKNVVSFRHVRMQKEPSAMCRDCFGSATAVSKWNRRAEAPAAPKVKALVWHDNPDIGEGGFIAKGVFGCAYHAMEDGWSYYRQGLWAHTKSLEAAKAAAQADYEARILAALEGGDA